VIVGFANKAIDEAKGDFGVLFLTTIWSYPRNALPLI